MEIEKINNTELSVKVYQNQRVVTFKDIDAVHERVEGTAGRNFRENKKYFIEGEDFFKVCPDEIRRNNIMNISDKAHQDIVLMTESGYLMLVKSFTDDLAWDVQRQLVKSYFRKQTGHNVQQLTVTSRDIAIMTTGKNLHGRVVRNIKDCIEELSEMGFDMGEFFILDSYVGGNKQENPQYLCTERGCEYYSGKLEPDARKIFIEEFTDRFERMRAVLEGRPVKKPLKLPKLISMDEVQEKEPLIRLFKTGGGGIVLINDEVHGLTQDEIETLSRFIPELEDSNIGQIQYVVSAFLRSMKKSGKLEEVASWGVKQEEPQRALLPDKAATKPKRSSSRDDNAPFITMEQAKNRYNMGNASITKLAKEAGAVIRFGRRATRYDRAKIDAYLAKEYSE